MESTFPLAKHLSLKGLEVDVYSLLPKSDQNTFVFDFLSNKQQSGFVKQSVIKKTFGQKLSQYLSSLTTKVFIYPTDKISRIIFRDVYYAFKLSRFLRKKEYDVIHIIHFSNTFWSPLFALIPKNKIIQTLHEVTSHESETPKYRTKILENLIKHSIPVIFHSNISRGRFIDFASKNNHEKNLDENKLSMIRFGLFETYHCFSSNSSKSNQAITILNIGRIVPYKGIDILINAVRIVQEKYSIHLIIAGNGKPYFNFDNVNSYEFINRNYTNEEVIELIEKSDMVVLPYISGSQSGVPMTVFAFNKPIIATNIAGFREVIEDMKTGILVNDLSAKSLAVAIERLARDKELRDTMSKNIAKKYSEGEYSWKSIAEKTILFYEQQITKQ